MIEQKEFKLIQKLYEKFIILKRNLEYDKKKNRLKEIHLLLSNTQNWKNILITTQLYKENKEIETIILKIKDIDKKIKKIKILLRENDKKNIYSIHILITELKQKIQNLTLYTMLSQKNDKLNCYIDIQSGSGGLDAQNWAKMLLRMYLKWLHKKEFKVAIIHESEGDNIGIKSATVHVSGKYAYGWLRTETGIHRLVRPSPFNNNKKRHTSFCSIFVYPEIKKSHEIKIQSNDLRIDFYRSSGAGGQHVNTTESAVRVTHIPTGIVTQSQSDRSQHKNKNQALKQLVSKLHELQIQKKKTEQKKKEQLKHKIRWGNQIRSYILDDARIKDLRTGIEKTNIQEILNGDLDHFIEASLKMGL
ncbi:peptide chain release factor 2 [Buchnera aphidicola]|uniref:peptide chain release factor 2 n=1 Tax=Buchnera aphidicola TaxID=9 RepID=UPI0039671BB9